MERVLQSRDPNVGGGDSPPSAFPSPSLSKPKDRYRRGWRSRIIESNSPTPPPPLPTPPAHLPLPSSSREGLRPRKKEVNYDTTFHKDLDPIIRPRATAKKQKTRAVSELSPSVDNFLMISDAESDAGEDFVDDSDPDSHSTRMFYDEEDRNVSRSNEADFDERDDTFFTCDTPMDPQDDGRHQSPSPSDNLPRFGASCLPNRSKRKRSSSDTNASDANLVEDLFRVAAKRMTQNRRSATSFDPYDDDPTIVGDRELEGEATSVDGAPSSRRCSTASTSTASNRNGTYSPQPNSTLGERLCIPPYIRSRLACIPHGKELEEARALAAHPSSLMQPAIMYMLLESWTSKPGPLIIVKPYLTQAANP